MDETLGIGIGTGGDFAWGSGLTGVLTLERFDDSVDLEAVLFKDDADFEQIFFAVFVLDKHFCSDDLDLLGVDLFEQHLFGEDLFKKKMK